MNGHSLLGVSLAEAQSFLLQPAKNIVMMVCDGYSETIFSNNNNFELASTQDNYIGQEEDLFIKRDSIDTPFPVPKNDAQTVGAQETLIKSDAKYKPTLVGCSNYDNLRSIDSDDSNVLSPENGLNGNSKLSKVVPKSRTKLNSTNSVLSNVSNTAALSPVNITDKSLNDIMRKKLDLSSASEFIPNNKEKNGHVIY